MNFLFLEGSPKTQGSASAYFLESLKSALGKPHECTWHNARNGDAQETAEAIAASDGLVVAFPLYVDGIPSHLLAFLEDLERHLRERGPGTRVYALCNCGFFEARQTATALRIMRRWCAKAGLTWGQALSIGAGGMATMAPMGRGPMASVGKALTDLAETMIQGRQGEDRFIGPSFPRLLYRMGGNSGWISQARKNGLERKALYAQPPYIPAP